MTQLADEFLTAKMKDSDRLLINLTDPFGTNNIGGFNLSNFKLRYLHNYSAEVTADY